MKKVLMIFLMILSVNIFAKEIDDIIFVIGLYSDGNYEFAETQIENFLTKYPQSKYKNEAKFMLANIYFSNKDYIKAIKSYEYLQNNFESLNAQPDIILNLAQSYFYSDNSIKKAENLLDEFIKEYKNNINIGRAYFIKAKIQHLQKKYSNALVDIKLAKKSYDKPSLYFLKIKVLLAQNKFDEALKTLQRVKENQKYYYHSIINIQQKLLSKKRYSKLIEIYEDNQIKNNQNLADAQNQLMAISFYEEANYLQSINFLDMIKISDNMTKYYFGLNEYQLNNYIKAKEIFSKLKKVEQVDIRTNSLFYLAKIEGLKDIEEANNQLKDFIHKNQSHKFLNAAKYQIGLNYFRLENYSEAQNYFESVETDKLDNATKYKSEFLLAECYFQLKFSVLAKKKFESLIEGNSEFIDESYFKLGLIYFKEKNYPLAFSKFDSVIKKYPNSSKKGVSLFYLGEVYFFKNQNILALEKYNEALQFMSSKENMINQRIAEIFYFQNKLEQANLHLKKVTQNDENKFSLQLLQGNIYFAQKEFSKSLKNYIKANSYTTTDQQKVIIKTKLAQNYYQLKKYELAAKTFAELSEGANNTKFMLMTANSYFKNNKYEKALQIYNDILRKFPETTYKSDIRLSIADSYYNNSQFSLAKDIYSDLIVIQNKPDNATVVNGFFWSATQMDSINLEVEVDSLLTRVENKNLKNNLLFRLGQNFLENSEYEKSIKTLNKIKDYKLSEVVSLKVEINMILENYSTAEELLQSIDENNLDAKLFTQWAEIHFVNDDIELAISKMKKVIELSGDEQLFLKLLSYLKDANSVEFMDYYHQFIKNAQPLNKAKAELIFVKLKIMNRDFEELDTKLDSLLQSDYELIRANAQFLKGKKLFDTEKYKAAIVELLRIRYLYPKYNELKLESEFLATIGYLKRGQVENAQNMYNSLSNQVSKQQQELYETELKLATEEE